MREVPAKLVLSYAGRNLTVSEWAREQGLSLQTFRLRLARRWPVERTLTERPASARPSGDDA